VPVLVATCSESVRIRLAQRIPVSIDLTNIPPDGRISAGMTCTVVLKEGGEPQIVTGVKRLLAALFRSVFKTTTQLYRSLATK
jgi:hypothetical protein